MKKCRQKHGGFGPLLTPHGTYSYRYLPLTNRDAMLLTKSFPPGLCKKFMAFLFSGQSLREKSILCVVLTHQVALLVACFTILQNDHIVIHRGEC